MSFAQRVLGIGEDSDTDEADTIEDPTIDETSNPIRDMGRDFFEESIPPAYSFKYERNYSFPEEITITTQDGDAYATITVTTPKTELEFDARISEYTSRFGELDVEMISVGGFAINLYHPKPEGEYFVRRLYYYEDDEGIGGEQHQNRSNRPNNPAWVRSTDMGSEVTAELDSHLRVYDWRENMLTTGKPTPSEGEVVLRFRDSLNAGGSNDRIDQVLTVDEVQSPVSKCVDVSFICVDDDNGEYVLYAPVTNTEWYIIRVPISRSVDESEVSWEHITDTHHRPSKKENLVWVRNPAHTWFTENP